MELKTELELDKPLFRFKTESEFMAEFGSINRIPGIWTSRMNYLFGMEIPYRSNEDAIRLWIKLVDYILLSTQDHDSFRWSISRDMILPIQENL